MWNAWGNQYMSKPIWEGLIHQPWVMKCLIVIFHLVIPEVASMTFICLTLQVSTSPFLRSFTFLSQKQTNKKIFTCVGLVRATQLLWAHGQWRPYFKPGLPNSGFYNCKLTCTMGGIRESVLPSASILLSRLYCKSPGFSSQEGEVKWTRHGLEANW